LQLDPEEKIILQLGRMVQRKGIDNVIRALGFMRREHNLRARLLIVGGESDVADPGITPEIGRLQQLAAAEEADDLVTFAGRSSRERLPYYYSAADVFATTPWYEPFGITVLESMACGTPVIGSDVGGIKSTILDGKTGFLVPPNEPAMLGERMAQLLNDHKLMMYFRENGMRHVHQNYTWMRATHLTADMYERIGKLGTLRANADHRPAASRQLKVRRKKCVMPAAPA
jgi:glycosyltransferase involved in cell wall biosynthesis